MTQGAWDVLAVRQDEEGGPMILTCGESLIDMLPRTTEDGEAAFAPYAGGSVFNTAIALGRLGVPVQFFTGLSTDLFGAVLEERLQASNVDTALAKRSDRPTTLAFVKFEDGHARYAFYDENTAGRMLTVADLPDVPDSVTACFFGSISLAVEPCATAYATLLERSAARKVVMIDPNIRPSFIGDETAYRARIAGLIAMADIVKLSDEDLAWLEGAGGTEDLARGLLARGPDLVCVTEGSEGALAVTETDTVRVPAQKVEVADTVGAGDTFSAGVLASLHQAGVLTKEGVAALDAGTVRAALELGIRAAAVTVSRAGANPPWAEELR